jgi:hypothetical protein
MDEYKEINDIYNEAAIEKRAPFIVNYEECDLPSPIGNRSTERSNDLKNHKIQEELFRKYYKPIDFNDIVGGQLDFMTKKKVKGETFKLFNGMRRTNKQIANSINIKTIVEKAKCKAHGSFSKITLSHLSPTRSSNGNEAHELVAAELASKRNTMKLMKKYGSILSSSRKSI